MMVLSLATALLTLLPPALAWSTGGVTSQTTPSGNYTPSFVQCPKDHTYVRPACDGVSTGEKAWLSERRKSTVPALASYLARQNISGFDVKQYIKALEKDNSKAPTIGFTMSGGGTRAELSDLGLYNALDGRVAESVAAGTGGLLQAVSYIAGLSGGSFATAGLGITGFPTVADLIANNNLNLTVNEDAIVEIAGKGKMGFPISIADIFGPLNLYNFFNINASIDPLSWTYSGIQAQPAFKNGSIPMAIIVAVEVIPAGLPGASPTIQTPNGTIMVPDSRPGFSLLETSLTNYEFNPFEFGSWTGRIKAFADLQYLGTTLKGGSPANDTKCVLGYDTAVFVTGACTSAINAWIAESYTNGTFGQFARRSVASPPSPPLSRSLSKRAYAYPGQPEWIPYPTDEATLEEERLEADLNGPVQDMPLFEEVTGENQTQLIYGALVNPFSGLGERDGVSEAAAGQAELLLVDAGESTQESPLWPLIQPARQLDFIIVADNCGSELSSGWMNGTNLGNTAQVAKAAGIPFPEIPSANTMLNLNHTAQPTFYGCNDDSVPLLLYAADYPYTAYTNLTSLATSLSPSQLTQLTSNGLPLLSQDSNRLRAGWTECIACAAIDRSLKRVGMKRAEACEQCFEAFCWDGRTNETQPSFLEPALVLNQSVSFEEWNATFF